MSKEEFGPNFGQAIASVGFLGLMGYLVKEFTPSGAEAERNISAMDSIERFFYRDYYQPEFVFDPWFDSLGLGIAFSLGISRNSSYHFSVPIATVLSSSPEIINGIYGHTGVSGFSEEVGYNFVGATVAYVLGKMFFSRSRNSSEGSIDDKLDEVISEYDAPIRKNPSWWRKT